MCVEDLNFHLALSSRVCFPGLSGKLFPFWTMLIYPSSVNACNLSSSWRSKWTRTRLNTEYFKFNFYRAISCGCRLIPNNIINVSKEGFPVYVFTAPLFIHFSLWTLGKIQRCVSLFSSKPTIRSAGFIFFFLKKETIEYSTWIDFFLKHHLGGI